MAVWLTNPHFHAAAADRRRGPGGGGTVSVSRVLRGADRQPADAGGVPRAGCGHPSAYRGFGCWAPDSSSGLHVAAYIRTHPGRANLQVVACISVYSRHPLLSQVIATAMVDGKQVPPPAASSIVTT